MDNWKKVLDISQFAPPIPEHIKMNFSINLERKVADQFGRTCYQGEAPAPDVVTSGWIYYDLPERGEGVPLITLTVELIWKVDQVCFCWVNQLPLALTGKAELPIMIGDADRCPEGSKIRIRTNVVPEDFDASGIYVMIKGYSEVRND